MPGQKSTTIAAIPYRAPFFLNNGHLQTIYPHLFRRKKAAAYHRKRIITEDQDFLDVDWIKNGSKKLAIITHGMEGSSQSHYVLGMVNALSAAGWDALCWNLRSCSEQLNSQPIWYHSGSTKDLQRVFSHALFKKQYEEIALIGFSIGANITLNFLGRLGKNVSSLITKAVAFCPPCNLQASAHQLSKCQNRIYQRHLLKHLGGKIALKKKMFPEAFNGLELRGIKSLIEFDRRFTAPLHGFRDAEDYWHSCSPLRRMQAIAVPTLVVSAANDPLLSEECHPLEAAAKNPLLTVEIQQSGGHLGFISLAGQNYWSEDRALKFLEMTVEQDQKRAVAANQA